MHQSPKKRAGRDDNSRGQELNIQRSLNAINHVVFYKNCSGLGLFTVKVFLSLAYSLDSRLVGFFVALCARCPNRRSLLCVKHSKLEASHVGCTAHLATQRINLPDQMSFCQSADGWIARHLSNSVEVDCEKQSFATHSCGGQCRLNAGMASPDDDHIIPLWIYKHEL